MAWPNTPLTTYLAGGLPYIKAFDQNAFQSAINGIINATYSLAAVVVDGTGGSVVVPEAGTCALSAVATASSAPTPSATWGKLYKESGLVGSAHVNGGTGALVGGFNVLSSSRTGAGEYTVILNNAPPNDVRCTGQVTVTNTVNASFGIIDTISTVAGDLNILVKTFDSAGVAADLWFYLNIWGG